MDCLFCKIIGKESPSQAVFENENVLAIKDIYPKAPTHVLILPKKHIESVDSLGIEDKGVIGEMIFAAKKIVEENRIKGYKLIINVGREGGQTIDHLHLHLMSGKIEELP